MKLNSRAAIVAATVILAACAREADRSFATQGGVAGAEAPIAVSVAPASRVIAVQMFTDARGSYYEPSRVEAGKGDIVRFTLKSGVHNVRFHRGSHASASHGTAADLPQASELLQLPEQTWDYHVTVDSGEYHFHCDPHAELGMEGRLIVR
jgi:plastocyanin